MESRKNMQDEFPALFEMYGRAEPSPEPGPGPEPPDTAGLSKEEIIDLIPDGPGKEALTELRAMMKAHPVRIYRTAGGLGCAVDAEREWKAANWGTFGRFCELFWGPAFEVVVDYFWHSLPMREESE